MKKVLLLIVSLTLAYISIRVGILLSFTARFYLDREYMRLTETGQDITLIKLALIPFTNTWVIYAFWGGLGLIAGWFFCKKYLK